MDKTITNPNLTPIIGYIEVIDENGEHVYEKLSGCEEPQKTEVDLLKEQIAQTDYKVIKCSECSLAGIELPYDIKVLNEERQALRDRINELEG